MCKKYLWYSVTLLLLFLIDALSYPTGKPDMEKPLDIRDEQRYPNGTVIGKYSYTDREGNPIQVKYYADDGSYGVELKSIKVVDSTADPSLSTVQPIKFDNLFHPTEHQFRFPVEVMNPNYPVTGNKYKTNDPLEYLNRENTKSSHYKIEKSNPDYDIYYQNELTGTKMCNNGKVRVYMDKAKRKIRSALDNFDAAKVCEQF